MLDVLGTLERTHTCGELREGDAGKHVVLMGWVAKKRDFGVLTFIDLRDREGVTQVVMNEEDAGEAHAKAKNLRGEFVIAVKGEVVIREGTHNAKLATGDIEVHASEILILNDAKVPPFQLEVAGSENLADESTRLKYRYLDLRRPQLQHNIRMRAKAVAAIREYFDNRGFIEIETPILLKSTPEGARDFIVPSRIHTGKFFALPQSPQILKQLTMISGFDKYYQIARCFRDEDLRADRQPEFTQLDMEMSFANQEMAYREIEGMFGYVFKLIGVDLPAQWPRMTYAEAMRRYGSDKPDLRFEMELVDLSDDLRDTDFAPFAAVLAGTRASLPANEADGLAGIPRSDARSGEIKCIVVRGKADYSRKQLDDLQDFVKRYGAGALAWIKVGESEVGTGSDSDWVLSSSLLKVLGEEKIGQLAKTAGAAIGDLVLIVAGRKSVVAASLGALRVEVAKREDLIDRSAYKPLIVTEFPMFEHDEDSDSYAAAHHPFTSPMDEDLEKFKTAVNDESQHHLLGSVRAKAYDAVINGYECAGGSIRIHQKDIQALNFKALGLSPEKARERFGFFLDALEYGTPPHGGFAAGVERTCMILCGTENIRDVMAFPKTASAQDLMMDSPGEVDGSQLRELGINVND
ncbi:MAG: aspartate--tRNA ligase [Pyrinomonadaceae bacterium]|nr:aspartate--tRNA ligase [Pyrinomonadaceae bacterium]MBP6212887.1 aspartate--tRNA ligase [Pyrinomonadaceae bacterium]